ncbi:MAG: sugar transferase [Patescibacteria group bacterium]|nr:sugar transferase [Patescibacteria group bacterium]
MRCNHLSKKHNEADGPVFKIHNDPRLTKFGAFLYHTGLDEIPQLFNVLFGTMAIIGPRPLPVEEARKLKPWQKQRECVLPGIISPWILDGYHKNTFNEWMESNIEYTQKQIILI